jgi:hypothetical protein
MLGVIPLSSPLGLFEKTNQLIVVANISAAKQTRVQNQSSRPAGPRSAASRPTKPAGMELASIGPLPRLMPLTVSMSMTTTIPIRLSLGGSARPLEKDARSVLPARLVCKAGRLCKIALDDCAASHERPTRWFTVLTLVRWPA